jgi:hypothetical protein
MQALKKKKQPNSKVERRDFFAFGLPALLSGKKLINYYKACNSEIARNSDTCKTYSFNCITPTLARKKNTYKSKMRKKPKRVEIFRRG